MIESWMLSNLKSSPLPEDNPSFNDNYHFINILNCGATISLSLEYFLNLKFKNKNKPTDVLSFPNNDKFINKDYLGDVAINFEIVDKRSKKTNFNYEFDRMWVHGYLHLLGFDHKKVKDFDKMSKIEKKILDCFDHTF